VSILPSARFGLNGLYDESLLKTTTLVGIGEARFVLLNSSLKLSRNCSSRVPTFRISFSDALPIRKKFFERICIHSSFAAIGRALSLGLDHGITVEAPFSTWEKSAVIARGVELGVPLEEHIAFVLQALRPVEQTLGLGAP